MKRTVTVQTAGVVLGIGRTAAYEGVRNGSIPSIQIGRRIVVPIAALARLLGEDAASLLATCASATADSRSASASSQSLDTPETGQ